MKRRVKVGIIGCGTISDVYARDLKQKYTMLDLVACADMFPEKAQALARKYGIAKACSVEELLADPEVEIVINLTIPAAHTEINLAALNAGKHVFSEKPFATNLEDARKTIELAESKGLMVGCSPDTFLGAGIQTSKKLLDEGWIGQPIAATANVTNHGHEMWHPNPAFNYMPGGGPMLDLGPYYITALVVLLGPIDRITCVAKKTFPERTILGPVNRDKGSIPVEVNTHYTGIVEFKNGAVVSINISNDIWYSNLPCLEIYGTEGTMMVPDPNMYGGPVKIIRGDNMVDSIEGLDMMGALMTINSREKMSEFVKEIPLAYHNVDHYYRGLGVLDMAYALLNGRPHRTKGDLVFHVTEALLAFDEAAKEGKPYKMTSTCEVPPSLPVGLPFGVMD